MPVGTPVAGGTAVTIGAYDGVHRGHRAVIGRVQALADLKRALEDTPMQKPSFVYTTYIKTTPEQLWKALTEPAFTERYWNLTFDTDWNGPAAQALRQFATQLSTDLGWRQS